MNILALDTSGPVVGCAVWRDGGIVASLAMNHGLTHSQTLMPAVDAVMDAAGLTAKDIDCFAAVAGPGSFTGVRIGICAAKGLAHAVGKPCVAVNALEALAANFSGTMATVCPILDARRAQVYCALFRAGDGRPTRLMDDAAIPLEALLDRADDCERVIFCGDGLTVHAARITERLGKRAVLAPANLRDLRPDAVCMLAAQMQGEAVEPARLRPLYLRAPQAERERNARLTQKAE